MGSGSIAQEGLSRNAGCHLVTLPVLERDESGCCHNQAPASARCCAAGTVPSKQLDYVSHHGQEKGGRARGQGLPTSEARTVDTRSS